MDIGILLCVESKDLLISISTQRNPTDRINVTDPLTKKGSAVAEMLRLWLFSGSLQIQIEDAGGTKRNIKNLRKRTEEYEFGCSAWKRELKITFII